MEPVGKLRQWLGNDHLGRVAAGYGARGLQVLPCHHPTAARGPDRWRIWACSCRALGCPSPGEHPLSRRFTHETSSDPERITAWWRQDPDRNIGLLTGRSFEVLDVPAGLGEAALERCARAGLAGPVVRTGGGRWHFYVTAIGMANGFVPSQPGAGRGGVFWHGEGGWVIAPPSRHLNGGTSRWLHSLDNPLPAARLVLRELLDAQEEQHSAGISPTPAVAAGRGRYGRLRRHLGRLAPG